MVATMTCLCSHHLSVVPMPSDLSYELSPAHPKKHFSVPIQINTLIFPIFRFSRFVFPIFPIEIAKNKGGRWEDSVDFKIENQSYSLSAYHAPRRPRAVGGFCSPAMNQQNLASKLSAGQPPGSAPPRSPFSLKLKRIIPTIVSGNSSSRWPEISPPTACSNRPAPTSSTCPVSTTDTSQLRTHEQG
jgi:hypothetical protein